MPAYAIVDCNCKVAAQHDGSYPTIARLVLALDLRLQLSNCSSTPSSEISWAWQPRAVTDDGAVCPLSDADRAAFDAAWQKRTGWAWRHDGG